MLLAHGRETKENMSASTSGTKTVTNGVTPQLTASALTALLAIPVESLTVHQLRQINDAVSRVPGGGQGSLLIGALLV